MLRDDSAMARQLPAALLMAVLSAASVISDQIVHTSSGHSVVLVNGKHYATCPGGYIDDYNRCIAYTPPQCPRGYMLFNGLCYLTNEVPSSNCPQDGHKGTPVTSVPCVTPPTPEWASTERPESSTARVPPPPLPLPPPLEQSRCPSGSVYHAGKCRKIICTQGEFYHGRCLQPACPEGSVWRGGRCQQPAFVTTILEIENVFINEAQYEPAKVHARNGTKIEYHVHKEAPLAPIVATTPKVTSTTRRPSTTTTRLPMPAQNQTLAGCCTIITPRMCKNYGQKWLCFNRRHRRCDPNVCLTPTVYLRTPQISYVPPVLIMPPNPPLEACSTPNCENSNTVDCSGCAQSQRDTCSPYCYRYMCPQNNCNFMDLKDYCAIYPGEFGCSTEDGCIWDWCS